MHSLISLRKHRFGIWYEPLSTNFHIHFGLLWGAIRLRKMPWGGRILMLTVFWENRHLFALHKVERGW